MPSEIRDTDTLRYLLLSNEMERQGLFGSGNLSWIPYPFRGNKYRIQNLFQRNILRTPRGLDGAVGCSKVRIFLPSVKRVLKSTFKLEVRFSCDPQSSTGLLNSDCLNIFIRFG